MQYVTNSHEARRDVGVPMTQSRRLQTQQHPELSEGLDRDVRRYDLLTQVKRVGKSGGFTPRMIQLLDYYMAYTRDCDWEEGAQPIVFQSVTNTAMDLGVSERQIQRMEQRLFEIGAIRWCDSGNHRRYGKRDPETGMLLYGFGVDLSPLASLQATLESIQAKRAEEAEIWRGVKRQVSWYRGQLRAMISSVEDEQGRGSRFFAMHDRYQEITMPIRSTFPIAKLRTLLEAHKELHAAFTEELNLCVPCELSSERSHSDDENVGHIKNTNQPPLFEKNSSPEDKVLQEDERDRSQIQQEPMRQAETSQNVHRAGGSEPNTEEDIILSTGLQHITLKQALNAASETFRSYIPHAQRPMNWSDIVEAAWKRRQSLRISQSLWAEACEVLGRTGAAVAILIVDQAADREDRPVKIPAAYLRAMVSRARNGQLNLQASVFAWMKKSFKHDEEYGVS